MRVVLDTNVIYVGLRSSRGASYQILLGIEQEKFQIVLGTTLLLEYEDVLKRPETKLLLTNEEVDTVLDYLASVATLQTVHRLWRPWLRDPKDDHLLELAVAANCPMIVTHNIKDFKNTQSLGVQAITPAAFLQQIGGLT